MLTLRSVVVIAALLVVSVQGQEKTEDNNWHRIKLDERFRSEGVAAADFNNDGRIDVVAGDVWYQAPEPNSDGYLSGKGWKIKEVRQPGEFVAGKGYSQSFVNIAQDVDGDGWMDVIIVGFPVRHPKRTSDSAGTRTRAKAAATGPRTKSGPAFVMSHQTSKT